MSARSAGFVGYRYAVSEFALLEENAAEAGLPWSRPSVERIEDGKISALRWGTGPIELV
jgi:hypothetical protein